MEAVVAYFNDAALWIVFSCFPGVTLLINFVALLFGRHVKICLYALLACLAIPDPISPCMYSITHWHTHTKISFMRIHTHADTQTRAHAHTGRKREQHIGTPEVPWIATASTAGHAIHCRRLVACKLSFLLVEIQTKLLAAQTRDYWHAGKCSFREDLGECAWGCCSDMPGLITHTRGWGRRVPLQTVLILLTTQGRKKRAEKLGGNLLRGCESRCFDVYSRRKLRRRCD